MLSLGSLIFCEQDLVVLHPEDGAEQRLAVLQVDNANGAPIAAAVYVLDPHPADRGVDLEPAAHGEQGDLVGTDQGNAGGMKRLPCPCLRMRGATLEIRLRCPDAAE